VDRNDGEPNELSDPKNSKSPSVWCGCRLWLCRDICPLASGTTKKGYVILAGRNPARFCHCLLPVSASLAVTHARAKICVYTVLRK
jgi:hypothetical protein